MKTAKLNNFTKGWIIGDFDPSLFPTEDFEIGVKYFQKGDIHEQHYHKVGTEYNVILDGECEFYNIDEVHVCKDGDIFVIEPGEIFGFKAIQNTILIIIKTPSKTDDKYYV